METPSTPPSPGKNRKLLGMAVTIVIAIAASVAVFYVLDYVNHSQVNTNDKATFSEYGFRIQYPIGSRMSTKGLLSSQPNSQSGQVDWQWNGGNTGLDVGWVNSSSYNYNASFNGIQSALEKNSTSVSVTGEGNTTIGAQSWEYETYQFVTSGTTAYATYAIRFYENEGRAYVLAFVDTTSDTLSSLDSWGATFQG